MRPCFGLPLPILDGRVDVGKEILARGEREKAEKHEETRMLAYSSGPQGAGTGPKAHAVFPRCVSPRGRPEAIGGLGGCRGCGHLTRSVGPGHVLSGSENPSRFVGTANAGSKLSFDVGSPSYNQTPPFTGFPVPTGGHRGGKAALRGERRSDERKGVLHGLEAVDRRVPLRGPSRRRR